MLHCHSFPVALIDASDVVKVFFTDYSDNAEAGMELFEDSIQDLFKSADTDNKGQITVDQFNRVITN